MTEPPRHCLCGCGTEVSDGARWVLGHNHPHWRPITECERQRFRARWTELGIEYGYCLCGCGGRTEVADHSRRTDRWQVAGEHKPLLRGHHLKYKPTDEERARHRALWIAAEIPYGYCLCGCGFKTEISPITSRTPHGYIAGEPRRYLYTHQISPPEHRRHRGRNRQMVTAGVYDVKTIVQVWV